MENQNQNPKVQLIERLKESNNVLVTVSRNPSVDQLSAAIGLTLMLNHLGKHATAVFSGQIPDTLEFLSPEDTLETTTDSLRDFIISLDKAKADKLRYKVEDKMVKIFITPYRTSLSEADLVFGQGDFNVDVVVALGVHEKEELDEAITSHGRILHDATVATVNTVADGQLGSINWVDARASSLCEMVVPVCEALKAGALDAQMSTAFLTGIVAETQRFSNEKTSSETMNVSAKLMNAGANQQLVATKLEQPVNLPQESASLQNNQAETAVDDALANDGSLSIDHVAEQSSAEAAPSDLPEIQPDHQEEPGAEYGDDGADDEADKPSRLILQPPTMGGKLTANTEPEGLDPSTDPLSPRKPDSPLLTHDKDEPEETTASDPPPVELEDTPFTLAPPTEQPPVFEPVAAEEPTAEPEAQQPAAPEPPAVESAPEPEAPAPAEPEQAAADDQTLSDLESAVDSPHITDKTSPDADAALAAAHEAFDAAEVEKPAAFNASGPMEVTHDEAAAEPAPAEPAAPPEPASVAIDPATGELSYPTNLVPPSTGLPSDPTAASVEDPTAPPPVPPPMAMPPLMPPHEPPPDPDNLPPVNP